MKKKIFISTLISFIIITAYAQEETSDSGYNITNNDTVVTQSSFSLLLDGGIRDIGAQTSNNQAATGLLGFEFDNDIWEAKATWILGSNVSNITSENNGYGKTLLNPNIGTPELGFNASVTKRFLFLEKGYGLFLLNRNRYQKDINDGDYLKQLSHFNHDKKNYFAEHLGVSFHLNVNQTSWLAQDSLNSYMSENMGIVYYGVDLIMTHYVFLKSRGKDENFNSDLIITYGAGLTGRQLFGDATQDDYFLNQTIGQTKLNYNGIEFLAKLEYSNFYAEFVLPVFAGDIKGFSSGQMLVNIGVSAKIGGEWKKNKYYEHAINPWTMQRSK